MMNNGGNCMCRESRTSFLLVYTLNPTAINGKLLKITKQQTTSDVYHDNKYIYNINTNEKPRELSRQNMISSQLKITYAKTMAAQVK